MARNSGISSHPMEREIIKALMAGKKLREIAEFCVPKVSIFALSRFHTRHIRPNIAAAQQLKSISDSQYVTSPEARANVQKFAAKAIAGRIPLMIRENRVAAKAKRAELLNRVVAERAEEMAVCEICRKPRDIHPWEDETTGRRCDVYLHVPGGTTGLIVRKHKAHGTEYAVDTGLLDQLSQHEKDIAIELGQLHDVANGIQLAVQIVCPWRGEDAPQVRVSLADGPVIDIDDYADMGVVQKQD